VGNQRRAVGHCSLLRTASIVRLSFSSNPTNVNGEPTGLTSVDPSPSLAGV
jgi:hypothetical protein